MRAGRLRLAVVAVGLAAAVLAGCGDDDGGPEAGAPAPTGDPDLEPDQDGLVGESEGVTPPGVGETVPPDPATGMTLKVQLEGAFEVPGPGHPEANGRGELTLEGNELCVTMDVVDLDDATITGAHVHRGPLGEAGPVVVDIGVPDPAVPSWDDVCVSVDDEFVEAAFAGPELFYVNVHTEEFPDGAVRGQFQVA